MVVFVASGQCQGRRYTTLKKGKHWRDFSCDFSVQTSAEKNGSWESVGTVLEMRPDKLSYLVDIEGKMLVRARYMLRPEEERGVLDASQVQVQGGAQVSAQEGVFPRRSERIKLQKEKEENSAAKCADLKMKMPSSGSSGALIDSIERSSKSKSICTENLRTKPYGRMQEGSASLTCSGQLLTLGLRQFLSSPSSQSQSLYAAGCDPRLNGGASIGTGNSCLPSLRPSCQGLQPGKDPVSLSPSAPEFTPRRQLYLIRQLY